MRILHTSDWHLGRSLIHKKRLPEQIAFLEWLIEQIQEHCISVLLVAGDVFDTATPGTAAQKAYYSFLCRLQGTCCHHVVITAGNHDSPSFLAAPREVLTFLNVHVVSAARPSALQSALPFSLDAAPSFPGDDAANAFLSDEVLVLDIPADSEGSAQKLIVCAVPFLRERDIRTAEAGESLEDKDRKALQGIRDHYQAIGTLAEKARTQYGNSTPIVVMGHLFAAGGSVSEGDGVRELAVGSLVGVPADVFPGCATYVALGHLHSPQTVAGKENIRYSGAPLHFGFTEASQEKSVCLVTFGGPQPLIEKLPVPVFQSLAFLQGDLPTLLAELATLVHKNHSTWVEVEYTGPAGEGTLSDQLHQAVAGSPVEILRIRDTTKARQIRAQYERVACLEDLTPAEVFANCLDDHSVAAEQRQELTRLHDLIVEEVHTSENQ